MQNLEKTAFDAGMEHVQGALLIMKAHQGRAFARLYAAGMIAGVRNYLAVVHSSQAAYETLQAMADDEILLGNMARELGSIAIPKRGEAA